MTIPVPRTSGAAPAGAAAARTAAAPAPATSVPRATYRLQFRPEFGFAEARQLIPFLRSAGVTHIYSSPLTTPRKGSDHGYDLVDPQRINPELGGEVEFDRFVQALRAAGMGLILDIVPNHMAACAENPWWRDVLEEGPHSEHARFFDIDWNACAPGCENKLVLPVLGTAYAEALESGALQLSLGVNGLSLRYYQHEFPLAPVTYPAVLAYRFDSWRRASGDSGPAAALEALQNLFKVLPSGAPRRSAKSEAKRRLWEAYRASADIREHLDANLAAYNGKAGSLRSFVLLDALLANQYYRLAYWATGRDAVNYRRFFDISELAGVRVEDEAVFDATHDLVIRLAREGKIQGVRIDHIDGLLDPAAYLRRLESRVAAAAPAEFYIVAEKVLLGAERLQPDWPVRGTTGYEFLDAVNSVFVDPEGLERAGDIYRRFTGDRKCFDGHVYEQKKRVAGLLFTAELRRLSAQLRALAARDPYARDSAPAEFDDAITEITARLPVYRTFVRSMEISAADRQVLETVIGAARANGASPALDFLGRVLLLDFPQALPATVRRRWVDFVKRWQQFTGPVMAKGMEDTACYTYNRLVSMNLVGGACRPMPVERFHEFNFERRAICPHGLNATSTHDTKRSEDVRARINVLSELPDVWEDCLAQWSEWNRRHKRQVRNMLVPDAGTEIMMYQVLFGAWPLDPAETPDFAARFRSFLIKAAREAKMHTSWLAPDSAYEEALLGFAGRILDAASDNPFLEDFLRVQAELAWFGAEASLAQLVLKVASPGVPDFYQGTLLWDFSLVDPDNRRPIDFAGRIDILRRLRMAEREDRLPLVRELAANWKDGRIKMYTAVRALEFRAGCADLFCRGEYLPLHASGPGQEHAIAFARTLGGAWVIAAVPRLAAMRARAGGWNGTVIPLPGGAPALWTNIFTGERIVAGRGVLQAAEVFRNFPVALLWPAL